MDSIAKLYDERFASISRTIIMDDKLFERACKLLKISINDEHVAIPRSKAGYIRHYSFCGLNVPRRLLRLTTHYCPLCIQEQGYFKRIWDHALVTSCSKHQARIIEKCHACEELISWDRPNLLYCQCGAALVDANPEPYKSPVSDVLTEILNTSDTQRYEDFLALRRVIRDLSTRLNEHFFTDGLNTEKLLSEGLKSELLAARNLANHILENDIQFQPRFTFVDFYKSENQRSKRIADLASNIIEQHKPSVPPVGLNAIRGLLDYEQAAAALGISRKQMLEIARNKKISPYSARVNGTRQITQAFINKLIMDLSNVELAESRLSITVIECAADQRYGYTLGDVIQHILDGTIQMTDFNVRQPLSEIKVVRPKLPTPTYAKYEDLVRLGEFIHFTGFDYNMVRAVVKRHSEIEYFSDGRTKGTAKYLTPEKARRLFTLMGESIKLEKNLAKLQKRSINDIPTAPVLVHYLSI